MYAIDFKIKIKENSYENTKNHNCFILYLNGLPYYIKNVVFIIGMIVLKL